MVLFGVGLQMGLPTESYYATIAIMDIAVAMTNAILYLVIAIVAKPPPRSRLKTFRAPRGLQYPLIQEYTLAHSRIPNMI